MIRFLRTIRAHVIDRLALIEARLYFEEWSPRAASLYRRTRPFSTALQLLAILLWLIAFGSFVLFYGAAMGFAIAGRAVWRVLRGAR